MTGVKELLTFWGKSLILLPGTFLHELSHLIGAMLIGARIKSFSILPKITYDGSGRKFYELGSVEFISRIKALSFIAGLAPISLWVLLWFLLVQIGVLVPYESSFSINLWGLFYLENLWIWFVMFQLIIGGKPSRPDIEISVKGFFSFSGLLLALCLYMYLYHYDEVFGRLFDSLRALTQGL